MKTTKHQLYHLFLLLTAVNMLLYYLFIGNSTTDIKQEFFDDPLFNHFFFVSCWLFVTWIIYFLCRDVLRSRPLTVLHLLATSIIVFVLPLWITRIYAHAPRRYVMEYTESSPLFGAFTESFILTIVLLTLSDILLLINFFKKD